MTPVYTPQLNGVAERKNQTILDMAISLLKAKKLPKQYWAEAVLCAMYLLNRCPTRSLQGIIPEEAWVVTNQVLLIYESLVVWHMQRS